MDLLQIQMEEMPPSVVADCPHFEQLACDVAIFIYDSQNASSFEYCAQIYLVCRCMPQLFTLVLCLLWWLMCIPHFASCCYFLTTTYEFTGLKCTHLYSLMSLMFTLASIMSHAYCTHKRVKCGCAIVHNCIHYVCVCVCVSSSTSARTPRGCRASSCKPSATRRRAARRSSRTTRSSPPSSPPNTACTRISSASRASTRATAPSSTPSRASQTTRTPMWGLQGHQSFFLSLSLSLSSLFSSLDRPSFWED